MIGSSVVESLREAALARATALGLPTTAAEDWRYVNVAPLSAALTPHTGSGAAIPGAMAVIDGRMFPEPMGTLPSLDDAAVSKEHARLAAEIEAPACWSWLGQQHHVHVRGQQRLTIDHHAVNGLSGWRLLIDVAPQAELDLVLLHRSASGTRASVGIVVRLGAGAHLRVSEVAPEIAGQLLVHVEATVARDASITWICTSRGGELLRWRGVVDLQGTGAHANISAVDRVGGKLQAHRHLRLRHQVGPTTSTQLFKTVLSDHAIASFDGLVDVAKGADGANAEQLSRTLLLSPTARGDTRPQLDIHADEVKAGHGATIGQLDADELLYLRMRGLDPATAKGLLVDGFVREVIATLPHAQARALVDGSTP
jgi:Fe-S cluster assembly scaffold protein SufB